MLKDFPKDNLSDFLMQYDIFVYHKQLDKGKKVIDMVKYLGIPSVCDIDDSSYR